jgi:hypothetical protein
MQRLSEVLRGYAPCTPASSKEHDENNWPEEIIVDAIE